MPDGPRTAAAVVAALTAMASADELAKLRRRLPDGEPALGVRMGRLFDLAKAAAPGLEPDQLELLLDEPTYEARMAAYAVLDFQARSRLGDPALLATYLRRHDAITAWDMVDRAAPRVVGAALVGGPYDVLDTLAASPDPLRRRSAITAPLWFARYGAEADRAEGFRIAGALAADPVPVVSNAVGIYAAHAGERSPALLDSFLDAHEHELARPALRLASRKRR